MSPPPSTMMGIQMNMRQPNSSQITSELEGISKTITQKNKAISTIPLHSTQKNKAIPGNSSSPITLSNTAFPHIEDDELPDGILKNNEDPNEDNARTMKLEPILPLKTKTLAGFQVMIDDELEKVRQNRRERKDLLQKKHADHSSELVSALNAESSSAIKIPSKGISSDFEVVVSKSQKKRPERIRILTPIVGTPVVSGKRKRRVSTPLNPSLAIKLQETIRASANTDSFENTEEKTTHNISGSFQPDPFEEDDFDFSALHKQKESKETAQEVEKPILQTKLSLPETTTQPEPIILKQTNTRPFGLYILIFLLSAALLYQTLRIRSLKAEQTTEQTQNEK